MSFASSCISSLSSLPYFEDDKIYKYIVRVLSYMNFALTCVNKFLKYQEYKIQHKIGAREFLKLNQNITESLLLNKPVKDAGKRFVNIRNSLPYPPHKIESKFKKGHIGYSPDLSIPKDETKDKIADDTGLVKEFELNNFQVYTLNRRRRPFDFET